MQQLNLANEGLKVGKEIVKNVGDILDEVYKFKRFRPKTYSEKDLEGGGKWISGVEDGRTYSIVYHPTKYHRASAHGKTKMDGEWVKPGEVATAVVTSALWGNKTFYDVK